MSKSYTKKQTDTQHLFPKINLIIIKVSFLSLRKETYSTSVCPVFELSLTFNGVYLSGRIQCVRV